MFQKLEKAREELEELQQEKQSLLKANRMLVEVLVAMEETLQKEGVKIDEMDEHSYSFHRGWQDHKESLRIEELDEDVDRQLAQLKKLIDGLEAL